MNSVLLDHESKLLAEEIKNLTDEELNVVYGEALRYVEGFNLLVQDYEQDTHQENIACFFSKHLARKRLIDFTTYTYPKYQVNDHHEVIGEYLDKWVNKEIKYLIVVEPPRHGKSEQISRRLPAFIFGRNPDAQIISLTYSASLARTFNRDVQRIIDSPAYKELFPKTMLSEKSNRQQVEGTWLKNSDMFEIVGYNGSYRSSGIQGGIAGRGADFLLIDDPIKNAREAYSKTTRDSVYQEYLSTISTRLEENGSILITTTRWNEDDPVGRILVEEGTIENGGKWVVLNFPAVKEGPLNENDYDLREEGEILWEDKYNAEALTDIYERLGVYWWSALYQGRPSPAGGGQIKEEWFNYYDDLPDPKTWLRVIQSYDTAFEEKQSNDYSVCTTWIETKNHDLYLWHVWRDRAEFPKLKRAAKELYDKYNPSLIIVEKKASGHSLIQELRTLKVPVKAIPADTSKTLRASVASPTIQAGRVYLPTDAPWLVELIAELVAFPNGAYDDQVDSLVQAINFLKGHSFEDFARVLDKMANEQETPSTYEAVKDQNWMVLDDNIPGNGGNGDFEDEQLNKYQKVLAGRL